MIKTIIRFFKTLREHEEQLTKLKSVVDREIKTKKVRISDEQLDLLITCAMLGITNSEQLIDIVGTIESKQLIKMNQNLLG